MSYFRQEDESNKTGKRMLKPEHEEKKSIIGKRIVDNKSSTFTTIEKEHEEKKSGIRLNPTKVEREKATPLKSLIEDFCKIWGKVNKKDLKKHKYFDSIKKTCDGKRSRDFVSYGNYGGELKLDKKLCVIDNGAPMDALDLACYLRDENLKDQKKQSIEACAECCRILFLHQRLKSRDSQEYAKSIMQAASNEGIRFGTKGKKSKTNFSQIKFG